SDSISEAQDAGIDTLDFSASSMSVNVTLSGVNPYARADGKVADNLKLTLPPGDLENVLGGSGNDTLISSGYYGTGITGSLLVGGAGNDSLIGGEHNDTLVGGAGDDTFRFNVDTPLGSDAISEAYDAGVDTLDFSGTAQPLDVNLNNANLTGRADGKVCDNLRLTLNYGWLENAVGGGGNDLIVGTGWHNL